MAAAVRLEPADICNRDGCRNLLMSRDRVLDLTYCTAHQEEEDMKRRCMPALADWLEKAQP